MEFFPFFAGRTHLFCHAIQSSENFVFVVHVMDVGKAKRFMLQNPLQTTNRGVVEYPPIVWEKAPWNFPI